MFDPDVIHQIDYGGSTPLHRVVQSKSDNRDILNLLIRKGVNPNLRDFDHRTALNVA